MIILLEDGDQLPAARCVGLIRISLVAGFLCFKPSSYVTEIRLDDGPPVMLPAASLGSFLQVFSKLPQLF